MTRRRLQLTAILAALLVVVLGVALVMRRGDPRAATEALFERIKAEIANHDAAGVIGELHPEYDVRALWPHEIGEAESVDDDANGRERDLARRGLAFLMLQQGEALHFDYTVQDVTPQEDGTVVANVEIGVGSGSSEHQLVSPATPHRFVLAWSGRFPPRLKIRAHDPIAVSR
jgi:hypothetical protein